MRVLNFNTLWRKLAKPQFTTYRHERKDRDWALGEEIQVVFGQRSKQRSRLGTAIIIKKQTRLVLPRDMELMQHLIAKVRPELDCVPLVSDAEAVIDGFIDSHAMHDWMIATYGKPFNPLMNRLTVRWTQVWLYVADQDTGVAKQWAEMLK